MKRIFTKGNVEVQNIKIGDIHYEFECGMGIKVEVIELPRQCYDDLKCWEWKSKSLTDDSILNYRVCEGFSHYGPNLYNYEAYKVNIWL